MKIKENEKDFSMILSLSLVLKSLIVLTACVSVVQVVWLFFSDFPAAFLIDGEIWSRPLHEFSSVHRVVILSIFSMGTVCWLGVLWQFWDLCFLYSQKVFFSVLNARCFFNIGRFLMGMYVCEVISLPFTGWYLNYVGITPQMVDLDIFDILEFDLLVAGLFFAIVAKIMEHAAVMQDEVDLTV